YGAPQTSPAAQLAAMQYGAPQTSPYAQLGQQGAYAAALQQQQLQQQQQQQQEVFTLPSDAHPGKEYSFQARDGRTVTFGVPAGMGPGSQVTVTY
ncbi:unnamed protein product, partial [Polarella glacialis]